VAMTAHAMKGDRERCLEAGMDSYISKPIQSAELYEVIAKFTPLANSRKALARLPQAPLEVFDQAMTHV
jgi:two-component system sensor histidine kinase/response regulator